MLIDRTDDDPESPTYGTSIHRQYLDNQAQFLAQDHELFSILTDRFRAVFEDWEGREEAADNRHDEPHDKRDLRIRGYADRRNNYGERLWLRRQRLKYKLKKDEIAKYGKAGRTIGDLGVEASLQGAWATKLDKEAVRADILLTTGGRVTRIHFCMSPTTGELQEVFANLQYPPESAYFVYFSDDSCYAVRTNEGVWRANLDISSCDASHADELFVKYVAMHPEGRARDDLQILADQCRAPIRIEAPSRHLGQKMKVTLQSNVARLFSGSTLTTVINGFANACIAQAIHHAACKDEASIVTAACQAGYVATVDVCREFEDIQFLKSSPVRDTEGNYRPLLNFGVLLRAYGTCKGDLPLIRKGLTMEDRANAFQKGLLQGLYPGVSFPFLDKLKANYEQAKDITRTQLDLTLKCTDTVATFTDDAVFRRYELSQDGTRMHSTNLGGLEDLLSLQFGYEHASHGADAILKKDYGLSCW